MINGLFGFWQDHKAERELASLTRLLPQRVKAVRGGAVTVCDAAELVPGDLILLAEGDRVPADGRIVDVQGLRVNTATVTGEANPVSRDTVPTDDPDHLQARNLVLAGTDVVAGRGGRSWS